MEQSSGHKKLIAIIIGLLLLLIAAGLFLSWWKPSRTTPDTLDSGVGFSTFDRPTTDRTVDVRGTDIPYTYTPPALEPVQQQTTTPPYITEYNPPADSGFYSRTPSDRSFVIPASNQPTTQEPIVSSYPIDVGSPIYTSYYRPVYVAPSTTTQQTTNGSGGGTGGGFAELDKQVFGYVSGLGWTQLLGDTGQQIFDIIYAMSPGGATAGTIGRFLPGAGGGGGGGGGFGFGGGGGGGVMEFGGRVTRVTQCTCSAASMLDINDVRGQSLSLIYQPGASTLYSNYNVNGTGQNVLGNYTSGGACLVYHGEDCTAEGSPRGTITQIGTSVQ